MHIQSYQIHNVLNVYRRQLSQANPIPIPGSDEKAAADTVQLSTESKSQSIMEKVADNVLKKITNVEPGDQFSQILAAHSTPDNFNTEDMDKDNAFEFNTIEANNHKETRSIAVDDSQVLLNRLNELAKAAVDRRSQ